MIVHNRIARMVQHDVTVPKMRVAPAEPAQTGLRIKADADQIHSKIFQQIKQGDGQKLSSSEAFVHNQSKKRKMIVDEEPVAQKIQDSRNVANMN